MKFFRTIKGELVNAVTHTLEQIDKYPNLKIHIGSDSQSYSEGTVYVTTIVYRYGNNGGHYIFVKEKITPRIRSEYNRLFDEGVRTIETFDSITAEIPVAVEALEFDYADVKRTLSSKLVSDFKGWVSGLPVRAVFKSGEMIAAKASDHIIRKIQH